MPSLGVAVVVPVVPPLHNTPAAVVVTANVTGCVTVWLTVFMQLLASVTVTVYVPAVSPVAVAVVCVAASFQE